MKAVRVHEYGKPPTLDDVPEPGIQGPLDVLVHVDAAGVCRTDLHIIEGQWADRSGWSCPTRSATRTPGRWWPSARP